MNISSMIVMILLLILMTLAIYRTYKKKMILSCGGNCSQCHACPKGRNQK